MYKNLFKKNYYKHGFITYIQSEMADQGLNKRIIRFISQKKIEPWWMFEKRLLALKIWQAMIRPKWSKLKYLNLNFQDISYYSEPKKKKASNLNEVDPEILKTYEKLGIPLYEQKALEGIAVDAIFDSISVATTYKKELSRSGVIFCSISEAINQYPNLIKKYFGLVVPRYDNFYATLNTAVFSDGTFVYIPKNTKCPMELSTYFRINEAKTGQFERTLIIADKGSKVSYLEGCTAPVRYENQLHAAVVELVALENAKIKYSTIQNWYPGDIYGRGGIFNLVTKRGLCQGKKSKIFWIQLETGAAITWKYPSCILKGNRSVGSFYSVALTNNMQQADTGTKMLHIGKYTSSIILAKGISAGKSSNIYRGGINILKTAKNTRNFSQCDSLILGSKSTASTIPCIEVKNKNTKIEHEATTCKISEEQMTYCFQRGINQEDTIALIVNGFCKNVLKELPMEFAVEAKALLKIRLENSFA